MRSLLAIAALLFLVGCESLASARPGQFVMIRGTWGRDPLLPRAFSLMSVGPGGRAEILAKTVGRGTALLERALPGAEIDILGPLGTSFPEPSADTIDLLGTSSEQDDRHGDVARAQRLAHLEAVETRQHHVENDHVRWV